MTEKTLDWLNHNRFRAYPFVNDSGLVVSGERIPDCFLLDCLVVDTRHLGTIPTLVFTNVTVTEQNTSFSFTYAGTNYTKVITGGTADGEGSVTKVIGKPTDSDYLHISFVFSSHAHILATAGTGTWSFTGTVLPTKIISVTASGVNGIVTSGSRNVSGYSAAGTAKGDVHLVDGYRTEPTITSGRVIVKVGNTYGLDPCNYEDETADETAVDCDPLLLFFCGQNAITSGDVSIKGGPGVSVSGGRKYTAKKDIIDTYGNVGIRSGESIPCIEIVAASELLKLYSPSDGSGSDS